MEVTSGTAGVGVGGLHCLLAGTSLPLATVESGPHPNQCGVYYNDNSGETGESVV